MYRITNRRRQKRNRSRFWLIFTVLFIIIAIATFAYFILSMQKTPVIKQSKAVVTKVSYQGKTKHYNEGDFNIDIPTSWQLDPRPPYTYQSFTWSTVEKANGQQIEVFEDTIPENFAVNRALTISGEVDHIELNGPASDNCIKYTKDQVIAAGVHGVPARWQGIDFLCNRNTTSQDVIGTSSKDGINIVKLKSINGTPHTFFFTYSDNQMSPDYSVFYNALTSFGMN